MINESGSFGPVMGGPNQTNLECGFCFFAFNSFQNLLFDPKITKKITETLTRHEISWIEGVPVDMEYFLEMIWCDGAQGNKELKIEFEYKALSQKCPRKSFGFKFYLKSCR